MATPMMNTRIRTSGPGVKEIKTNIRQGTEVKNTSDDQHRGNTPRRVSSVPVHSLGTVHGTVIEDEFKSSENKNSGRVTVLTQRYQTETEQNSHRLPVSNNTSETNESLSHVNKTTINRETTRRLNREINQVSEEAPQMNNSHIETPSQYIPVSENSVHLEQSQTIQTQKASERKNILRQINLHKTVKSVENDPKRTDDIKQDISRQNTKVKPSSSRPNTEMVPSRSFKNVDDKRNISRFGTEVKQNSSRANTEVKQNSSHGITEVNQNSFRVITEVNQNSSRLNTEVKQNSSRANTDVKQNSSRANTVVKQNSSRQISEVKHSSSRPKTEMKHGNTRPNTQMNPNSSSRPNSEVKHNKSGSYTEANKHRQLTDKTPSHLQQDTEAKTELKRNNSTRYKRNQVLLGENEDGFFKRQVTPYNTSFSRQGKSRESISTTTGDTEDKDDNKLPALAITSSTDSAHPGTIENGSMTQLKQSMSGCSQCPYCDMTFTSTKLLQFHKSKFCIANPLVQDVYTLFDTREFFTMGGSRIIHSTPRGCPGTGIRPVKISRDYTLDDNETKFSKFHWDKCFNGKVPRFAVKAGFDQSASCSVYVGRANVDKELVPGKVVPATGCAYVSTGGQEHIVTHYEVLTDPHELLSWQHTDVPGGIPRGAQKGGYDASGLVYFVARALAPDGNMCCGKYVPQDMKCFFSWQGQEHFAMKFEFLCKKL